MCSFQSGFWKGIWLCKLRFLTNNDEYNGFWENWDEMDGGLYLHVSVVHFRKRESNEWFWSVKRFTTGRPSFSFSVCDCGRRFAAFDEQGIDFGRVSVNEETLMELIQFVDDTLIIGGGGWKNLWSIKAILRGFDLISRLGVNFHMSRLIGINRILKALYGGVKHHIRMETYCSRNQLLLVGRI